MKNTQQAIKEALKGCNRTVVAKSMQIAVGSLNNQVAGERPYWPKGTTLNFCDRTMNFIEAVEAQSGKLTLLEYMAEEFGCILIKNPAVKAQSTPALAQVAEILRDFSSLVDNVGQALEDSSIDTIEAEKIRAQWEVLKRVAEEFTLACETGIYNTSK